MGKRGGGSNGTEASDLLVGLDSLVDAGVGVLIGFVACGAILWAIGRWPWPEATRGPWMSWSWSLAASALAALVFLAVAVAEDRYLSPALGASAGALAVAVGLRRGERDDAISQNPKRRRRSARKMGPADIVMRSRLRSAYERGSVEGLCAEGVRHMGRMVEGGIAIGRDRRGVPVRLTAQQILRSGVVTGTVGSGKTTTARAIVSRAVQGGFGAIWVEAKADPEMRDWLICEATRRGVPFHEFRISGRSQRWNPLAGAAGPVERRDLIYQAAAHEGPEYFSAIFKEHALVCLRVLETTGREPSLPALKRVWRAEKLERLARSAHDLPGDLERYIDELLAERNARRRAEVESTGVRLADVVDACAERLQCEDAEPGDAVDLRSVVDARAVCLISLDAPTYPAVTKALGQLVVADAMAACAPWIERRELARCFLVLDEFPRYAGPQAGELMALSARAAGMPVVLITQDIADLDEVSDRFRSQVMGVANYYVTHSIGSPDSADYLARVGGMTERIEATHQVDRMSLGFDRVTGMGTEAHGRQWVIHPDELQRLRTGQAALVTKNPHTAAVVDVYRPESVSETLSAVNAARRERALSPVGLGDLDALHAAARARAV